MLRDFKPACCVIAMTRCRPGLTYTKLQIKANPTFTHFYLRIQIVCLKNSNRALLNYSLGGLCHFPAGGYTHAALETV